MTDSNRHDLERELRDFIARTFLFGRPATMAGTASLQELGVIDSTGVLELVGFLQTQYGFQVGDEEMHPRNLDSIEQLVAFVQRKRAG